MDLKIATYNVHGFPWLSPPIKQIVGWITRSCDIVALQEIWCRWPDWSAAFAAAGWVFLHPARESHFCSLFGSGLAYAWRSTSWTLTDSRQYPFLAGVGLDSLATKGWFRIDLVNHRGFRLRLVNMHLQSDVDLFEEYFRKITDGIRQSQARQMMQIEQRTTIPTLFLGDLNTEKDIVPGVQLFPADDHVDGFTGIDRCGSFKDQNWHVMEWRSAKEAEGWSDHLPIIYSLRV
jgi:endonuclease/exonuclease/phosphatase family metal-dependent hydrolase